MGNPAVVLVPGVVHTPGYTPGYTPGDSILAGLEDGIAAFKHGPELSDHARERIRDFLRAKGNHE